MNIKFSEILSNVLMIITMVLFGLLVFATWSVELGKDKFDDNCRNAGGIPLRSTFHYDAKDKKIHYVCIKQTSIMHVEGEIENESSK